MPTYRIHGNSEEDGRPVSLDVDAPDEGKAALIAERNRVRVGKIETTGGTPVPPAPKPSAIRRVQQFIDRPGVKIDRGYVWPMRGEIRRQTESGYTVVRPEDVRLSDIAYGRGGHAYLKLDYGRLFWTIAWAFVVGNILLWLVLFAAASLLVGGTVLSAVGGAAAARDAMRQRE
jgi:hypothetical protein